MKRKVFIPFLIIIFIGVVPSWSQEQSVSKVVHELPAFLSGDKSGQGNLFGMSSLFLPLGEKNYLFDDSFDKQGQDNHQYRMTPASSSASVTPQALNQPIYLAASKNQAVAAESQEEEEKRWSSFLPFMSEEAASTF
jgi:hypothetical protein